MPNIQTESYSKSGNPFSLDKASSLYKVSENGADVGSGGIINKKNIGSLAAELVPSIAGGEVDILHDYAWSMTIVPKQGELKRDDIPFIKLKEYRANEASIKRQALFFLAGGSFLNPVRGSTIGRAKKTTGVLDVYDEIFPRDNPTGWRYTFPFFSESNIEVTTDAWPQVDDPFEAIKKTIGSNLGVVGQAIQGTANIIEGVTRAAQGIKTGGVINIFDRPKAFSGHAPRSIRVEFPLYNTITPPQDGPGGESIPWSRNKDFIFLFANQNLFNKRDLTTGISPVFYEVLIPGQFYSVACCVTEFKVTNVGATRTMYSDSGKPYIVPDAYQISITLSDLTMPSRNSFQASDTFEGYGRVISEKIVKNTIPLF